MFGGYEINVNASGNLPQKVQSGFDRIFGDMVGADYDPIAYLGHQTVDGTNHAILALQNLVIGRDAKNIVLIILNEKPGDKGGETITIASIEQVLKAGGALGGLVLDPTTGIPADAKAAFDKHFGGFIGANNVPFALLGTQAIRGGAYVFAVESSMVVSPSAMVAGRKAICIVKVYGDFMEISIDEILRGQAPEGGEDARLGYAFTWLKDRD